MTSKNNSARKNRAPKAQAPVIATMSDEALLSELKTNEAAAPQTIDHSSQLGSWSAPEEKQPEPTNDEIAMLGEEMLNDAPESETVAEVIADQAPDFNAIRVSFDSETLMEKAKAIVGEIDARIEFQKQKDPDNSSIQKTLDAVRKEFVTLRTASVLCATNVDPDFVNRVTHEGVRFNVYALGKIADVCRGLSDETLRNAINLACMRSLFRCRAAGIAFTGEIAKACASDKIRIDAAVSKHLVRHTVSASTAPTQASSTMQALVTLGVVTTTGGKSPVYTLTNNPIVAEIEKRLAA